MVPQATSPPTAITTESPAGSAVVVVGGVVVGVVVVPPPVSTSSCGWLAVASRLGRLLLVLLVVSSANETGPGPVTSDVTSNDTVVFAAIGAGDAIAVAPVAGRWRMSTPSRSTSSRPPTGH